MWWMDTKMKGQFSWKPESELDVINRSEVRALEAVEFRQNFALSDVDSRCCVDCTNSPPLIRTITTITMDDFDVDTDDDVPMANLKKKKPNKATEDNKKKTKKPAAVPDVVASKSKSGSSGAAKKPKAKRKVEAEDDNDDEDRKPPSKKKIKVEETTSGAGATPTKQKELKRLDKAERMQYAMQAFLWWDAPEPPPGCQWVTMEHTGVSFPEPYVPHGVKMLYDGKPVDLTPIQEEA